MKVLMTLGFKPKGEVKESGALQANQKQELRRQIRRAPAPVPEKGVHVSQSLPRENQITAPNKMS